MKVKDLLKHIEECRKRYPDLDEWDVYTEQPGLIAPENNIPHKEWLYMIEKRPNVFFSDKKGEWVAVNGLGETFYFDSEKEATEFADNWNSFIKDTVEDIARSSTIIEQLEKEGWKFTYDSEGWVYRDIAGDGNHTVFEREKIFTINNNY